MTASEKRKLFRKRWLQAFFSPFRRVKHGTRLENGVYDADDKNMRDIYFVMKMFHTAYLVFMCFFFGSTMNTEGIPSDINFRSRILRTILLPTYFFLHWIKHTFFLAAFAIDDNERAARAEIRYNSEINEILRALFVGLMFVMGVAWFRALGGLPPI